jgi:hypothetical protein
VAAPIDPAVQARGFKTVAAALAVGGLMIGIVMPAFLAWRGVYFFPMSSGFDAFWFGTLAIMAADFVIAGTFWRRAAALDRAAQGLPPRGQ